MSGASSWSPMSGPGIQTPWPSSAAFSRTSAWSWIRIVAAHMFQCPHGKTLLYCQLSYHVSHRIFFLRISCILHMNSLTWNAYTCSIHSFSSYNAFLSTVNAMWLLSAWESILLFIHLCKRALFYRFTAACSVFWFVYYLLISGHISANVPGEAAEDGFYV